MGNYIFFEGNVEYINLERASCPGNGELYRFFEGNVEHINLERASCPGNGELYILLK